MRSPTTVSTIANPALKASTSTIPKPNLSSEIAPRSKTSAAVTVPLDWWEILRGEDLVGDVEVLVLPDLIDVTPEGLLVLLDRHPVSPFAR